MPPNARRANSTLPPEHGIIAPSSASERPPHKASTPPMTQAARMFSEVPSFAPNWPVSEKIPLPTMEATIIPIAPIGPTTRKSCSSLNEFFTVG